MADEKGKKQIAKAVLKHNLFKAKLIKQLLVPEWLFNVNSTLEPDWYSGNLNGYPGSDTFPPRPDVNNYQQNELLQPVYSDIVNFNLHTVYEKYTTGSGSTPPGQTAKPKVVVIIGAGMAGLSAAYELLRAGHQVKIVETQARAGGRIKTFTEKDGFAKEQYADAGAMRLPNTKDVEKKFHYLTDHYITEFGLDTSLKLFKNSDSNGFVKYYNMDPIRRKVWDQDEYTYTSAQWPDWDLKFKDKSEYDEIQGINGYYEATFATIRDQLITRLQTATDNAEAAEIWETWVLNWSRFSLVGLMRSNLTIIQQTLDADYWDMISGTIDQTALTDLLPWPEIAIKAFSIFNYTEQLDQCLVQYLRDELGSWWSDNMHHIDGGMYRLTEKFLHNDVHALEGLITYNFTVTEVEYSPGSVSVKGYHPNSHQPMTDITGDAVIVTVPLHAIRQIRFTSPHDDVFPNEFYQAVEDIWYGPSTKIMVQSKTKFWANNDTEADNIYGGFTKTNLPIGQMHYPTIEYPNAPGARDGPGILLCYMWKAEALLFGALEPQTAVRQAVSEIAQIHPEIIDEFESGAIHAWYSDPAAQGAYALLKPHQFLSTRYLMLNPFRNIFFAGEGISHCTGWIQGALESGLRAAYQFYSRNERNPLLLQKPEK